MTDESPASILVAAADLIRDLAAETTKPRPNGHGWSVPGEEDGWEPDWSAVVSCAGYGGEDVVACDVRVGDARWIAALSPAIAGPLEAMLRQAAHEVTVSSMTLNSVEFKARLADRFAPALALAARVLGEETHG